MTYTNKIKLFNDSLATFELALVGTFFDRRGSRSNVFQRTLESVPEIDALCFALEGERLTQFMEGFLSWMK
jgi:hypothetical protein